MHPEIMRDEPGCPICGMNLVKKSDWGTIGGKPFDRPSHDQLISLVGGFKLQQQRYGYQ
jgi:hypothetical protein